MSPTSNGGEPPTGRSLSAAGVDIESLKRPAVPRAFQAKKTRVLVIGAGMSGLACARELQQRGYQVLVVEARDRLGGRLKGGVKTNDREGGNEGMKTLPTPIISPDNKILKSATKPRNKKDTSTPVDLGGALIHGINDNPIYAITEQMGIPTSPVFDCLLFNESGWPIDTKEDERISALFNECLEETFDRVARHSGVNGDTTVDTTTTSSTTTEAVAALSPDQSQPASENCADKVEKEPSTNFLLPKEAGNESESKTPASTNTSQRNSEKLPRRGGASSKDDASKTDRIPNAVNPAESGECSATKLESFGDVFDRVCKEKSAPTSSPLFQWHQANLEVSCGASFPDLGYKWNDDEPYGYDGAHVAVKTSWKPVLDGLAEGLDVLYQSPVKQIVLVVPDPHPDPTTETIQNLEQSSNDPHARVDPISASVMKKKRKRPRSQQTTPLPSRRSRRLQGDDADARRSTRINKGQMVDRFLVTEFSRETYDDSAHLRSPAHDKQKQRLEHHEPEEEHTTVQVTLEDGTVLEAEAVVCTLPLGILKLSPESKKPKEGEEESPVGIRFHPPLPERKQRAIERLGCGLLNKCVLSFSHVFWQDSDFLGLAHPANSYLVLNVASFTNKPILTFMYGGTFAKEIEAWTDNEIVGDCMEVLRIICGKRDIPSPLDYTVTRWGHERYSLMSFSYVPPGVDGMEEFRAMSEPVYDPLVPRKPVLMFAGEHTSPFHPSTIHGAFLSGIREAYRLDLVVEAEANGHLEFDDEHLYQHTFAVRRQFQSAKSAVARAPARMNSAAKAKPNKAEGHEPSSETELNGNKRLHRRRGAASVMNLRQRPETSLAVGEKEPSVQKRKKPQQQEGLHGQNGQSVSTARRSRRSLYALQHQKVLEESSNILPLLGGAVVSTAKKAPPSGDESLAEKKHLVSLESRTLMRALESYGHNYAYIHSKVLPVFGSMLPPKTLPQARARCQQMIRSIISSASAQIPKRILSSWVAKNVYEPPKVELKPKTKPASASKKGAPRSTNKPESLSLAEGTRRSSRATKQRQLMNL